MTVVRALLFLGTLLVPVSAAAVTVRDIIELTNAGLSDEILIAVIDADRTVFTLDKEQILELKQAGVSKAVLLKMLRTRKEFETPLEPAPAPATTEIEVPQPEVVVIGTQAPPPPVTVVVPQYFVVPYSIWGIPAHHTPRAAAPVLAPEYRGFGRFINDGWVDRR